MTAALRRTEQPLPLGDHRRRDPKWRPTKDEHQQLEVDLMHQRLDHEAFCERLLATPCAVPFCRSMFGRGDYCSLHTVIANELARSRKSRSRQRGESR